MVKWIDRDPLDLLLKWLIRASTIQTSFWWGAIGCGLRYDLYEEIGQIPSRYSLGLQTCISLSMELIWFLTTRKKIQVIEDALIAIAVKKIWKSLWAKCLRNSLPCSKWIWRFGSISAGLQTAYRSSEVWAMVETARGLIRNGDMFQCVLSQRFSAEVTEIHLTFYRNSANSIHLFLMNLGINKSSELVLKVWFR